MSNDYDVTGDRVTTATTPPSYDIDGGQQLI
jgi:hypothetical protein